MLVASASRPPTTARLRPIQNTTQVGPKTSARPPARKPATMIETATQDTARPWNVGGYETGIPAVWGTDAVCSAKPAGPGPAAALPKVPGSTWCDIRAAPLVRLLACSLPCQGSWSYCGQAHAQGSTCPYGIGLRMKARLHPGSRLPC